jgi:general stress protein CsbA
MYTLKSEEYLKKYKIHYFIIMISVFSVSGTFYVFMNNKEKKKKKA